MARNKKLSNELTVLRVSHQDLQGRLEALQAELSDTNLDLEKARTLNETLEAGLEKVQQEASNAFDPSGMSVAGTYVSRYPQSSFAGGRRGRSSPTSSIISGFDNTSPGPGTLSSLRASELQPNTGILPMITAQRDRFKKRNSELEAELQKSHQTISSLRSEINALQKDNLDLYEKTRYVSSYNAVNRGGPSSASSASAFANNPNPSTINVEGDLGAVDSKYRPQYESNISPFAAFRGRESARAMKRMHLFERMVLRVTKFVLQTRTSRNIFAGYLLALHFMVFYFLFGYETGSVVVGGVAGVGGPVVDGDVMWHK